MWWIWWLILSIVTLISRLYVMYNCTRIALVISVLTVLTEPIPLIVVYGNAENIISFSFADNDTPHDRTVLIVWLYLLFMDITFLCLAVYKNWQHRKTGGFTNGYMSLLVQGSTQYFLLWAISTQVYPSTLGTNYNVDFRLFWVYAVELALWVAGIVSYNRPVLLFF